MANNNTQSILSLINDVAVSAALQLAIKYQEPELLQLMQNSPPSTVNPVNYFLEQLGYTDTIRAIEKDIYSVIKKHNKPLAMQKQEAAA